jgi:hypothetical protein
MLLIALGQHIFLLGRQNRKLADFRQIAIETGFAAERGN